MTRPVAELSRSARAVLTPALAAAIATLHPDSARVAGYHLGWVEADGRARSGDGGKALRPTLALLSASATGAPAVAGLPGAVAVELVHCFSLLHDDVMDGDELRHHRPAAWTVFGAGRAIIAGDDLLVLAMRQLLDAGAIGEGALRLLTEAIHRLVAGQAQDLAFEERDEVSVAQCVAMSADKTGALFACAASIGAVLAGAGERVSEPLASFGLHLGIAFQAVDDLLGIWGQPDVTGKPAGNDLRRRKKSLPVVIALARRGPGAERLRELLDVDGIAGDEDLELAAKLVAEEGGRRGTEEIARAQLEAALASLARAPITQTAHDELSAVAHYVTRRDW